MSPNNIILRHLMYTFVSYSINIFPLFESYPCGEVIILYMRLYDKFKNKNYLSLVAMDCLATYAFRHAVFQLESERNSTNFFFLITTCLTRK